VGARIPTGFTEVKVSELIGVLEGTLYKPQGSLTVQNFDLLFFPEQLVFQHMGDSGMTAAMLGNLFLGVFGSVNAAAMANRSQDQQRNGRESMTPAEICSLHQWNFSLPYAAFDSFVIRRGFFSSLWLLAPLWIECLDEKYFVNVPYGQARLMDQWISQVDELSEIVKIH